MNHADDRERLIQEVLTELGWDAEPGKIAKRVRRLDLGLPAEDEFTAICSWLGNARLIHKLDQHQVPVKSRDCYQVPDLLAQFENTGPLLIEIKSRKKQVLSFRPDYLQRLRAYAELVNMPLLIAWKYRGVWMLFEARHLAIARKNFNIRLGLAMRENLLGLLAGDVAYKIAPGAGVRFHCKKEELLTVEEEGEKVTERWRMQIDDVDYTVAGGTAVGDLDPEVATLFATWDLTRRESHGDTHIELHFVAGDDDGMMFAHTALTHLLNWTLPKGSEINWRHAIRREAVVGNMTNFGNALNLALEQQIVRYILHQEPQSRPKFELRE